MIPAGYMVKTIEKKLIRVEAYEESKQEKELLRLLLKGEKEIDEGEGCDLNTVLSDADAILGMKTRGEKTLPFLTKSIFIRFKTLYEHGYLFLLFFSTSGGVLMQPLRKKLIFIR
jgi:hypothetical protein